jgi:UDP-N-acetylmuramate--alanine ligase
MPIYPAGEEPIPGITAERLVELIERYGHRDVSFAPDAASVLQVLEEKARKGDLLITLGAGDVWKVGEQFLRAEK